MKSPGFKCFWISNGQISDLHCKLRVKSITRFGLCGQIVALSLAPSEQVFISCGMTGEGPETDEPVGNPKLNEEPPLLELELGGITSLLFVRPVTK